MTDLLETCPKPALQAFDIVPCLTCETEKCFVWHNKRAGEIVRESHPRKGSSLFIAQARLANQAINRFTLLQQLCVPKTLSELMT